MSLVLLFNGISGVSVSSVQKISIEYIASNNSMNKIFVEDKSLIGVQDKISTEFLLSANFTSKNLVENQVVLSIFQKTLTEFFNSIVYNNKINIEFLFSLLKNNEVNIEYGILKQILYKIPSEIILSLVVPEKISIEYSGTVQTGIEQFAKMPIETLLNSIFEYKKPTEYLSGFSNNVKLPTEDLISCALSEKLWNSIVSSISNKNELFVDLQHNSLINLIIILEYGNLSSYNSKFNVDVLSKSLQYNKLLVEFDGTQLSLITVFIIKNIHVNTMSFKDVQIVGGTGS